MSLAVMPLAVMPLAILPLDLQPPIYKPSIPLDLQTPISTHSMSLNLVWISTLRSPNTRWCLDLHTPISKHPLVFASPISKHPLSTPSPNFDTFRHFSSYLQLSYFALIVFPQFSTFFLHSDRHLSSSSPTQPCPPTTDSLSLG
jgi:hypothetical protein